MIYIAPGLPHNSHTFLFCSRMESFAECLVVNCNGILLPSGIIGLYLKNRYAAVLVIGRRLDWRSRRSISIVNFENKKSIEENVELCRKGVKIMTRNEEIFKEKEFYRAEILKMSKKIDDEYWLRSIYVFLNTLLK